MSIDDRTRALLDDMKHQTLLVKEPTNDYEFLESVVEALRQARRSWTKSYDLSYILIDQENKCIELMIYENGEKRYKKLLLIDSDGMSVNGSS